MANLTQSVFRQELEALINKNNMEAGSNTPDHILADFLWSCLIAFDTAVRTRGVWYAPQSSLPPSAAVTPPPVYSMGGGK
jgi:hypothetical protein